MKSNMKYYLLMVLSTLLFAGAFIAGKLGISSFSPIVMTFLRIGLATIIIFPIMILTNKKDWKPSKSELILSFKLGLLGMTFYHLLFFSALKYTTATNAAVINGSMPILTAIIARFILKEKLSKKKIVLILIAFIGVLLTITNWNLISLIEHGFNKGDLIMICATTSWSLYGVLIKKDIGNTSPLKLTSYTLLICTMIVAPFAVKEILYNNALNVQSSAYLAIIYMAIFPTVIGYTAQQTCIKHIGPSKAALFINLVPVFSITMAVIFLKESFNILTLLSASIIIISVVLFTKVKD